MTVIDPEHFAGLGPFEQSISDLIERVKQPPFAEGFDEVMTAGEPERRRRAERLAHGIDVEDSTWQQLCDAGVEVGAGPYEGSVR